MLYDTTAVQSPGSVFTEMFVEQEMDGGSVSLTVTVKLHETALLLVSVTVKLFVVIPLGKAEPLGNPAVWVSTCPGQLSLLVTV